MHVLRVVVGVVEVDDALVVGLDHVLGQQHAHREILGDLAGHVVALHGVDRGVLVGVLLLDLLVVALDEGQDLVVGGVGLALEALHVAVRDVVARDREGALGHDLVLYHVLDLLDSDRVATGLGLGLDDVGRVDDLLVAQALLGRHGDVGALDRGDDLVDVERDLGAVALHDLHGKSFRASLAGRGMSSCERPQDVGVISNVTCTIWRVVPFLFARKMLREPSGKSSLDILGGLSSKDTTCMVCII